MGTVTEFRYILSDGGDLCLSNIGVYSANLMTDVT